MIEFPFVSIENKKLIYSDGMFVRLPNEYKKAAYLKLVDYFYLKKVETSSNIVILEADPFGFCSVHYKTLTYVGLIINGIKGVEAGRLKKKYPNNRFDKDYIIHRIKKEYSLLSFEEVIPIELVKQNLHEIRNLNSKISGVIDDVIDANTEVEWDEKFDKASENVKKIYVGSRLIKFLLDNIKFLSPNYFNTLSQNRERSFIVHRSVSKIVKIYSEDFKKKKANIVLEGNSFKKIFGDKELFEVVIMLLIENAIKYSIDVSSISPKVSIKENANSLTIKVSSFGTVIPKEERESIFIKGFRSKLQTIKEGTGMGLHNARELLKVFKSEIQYQCDAIDNSPNGWNHFTIKCNEILHSQ
jgi:two-component system sensor histidine kinase ArlS